MTQAQTSSRFVWGAVGLFIGYLLGRFPWPMFPLRHPAIGVPEVAIVVLPLLFITVWILLIAAAIRWLFIKRDGAQTRLADLPADFDDWHRRAHAQMDREAASRAGAVSP